MTSRPSETWQVGDLPFIWNPLPSPHNPEGLPDTLPFSLGEDATTGALVQVPSPRVTAALARAYSLGSMITGQMDERGIGRRYADDFLDFLGASDTADSAFRGRRVLEVGCGNGYLLHRLARQGADVVGLEPGEHNQSRFDVPVIRDFFPSSQITGTFDAIIAFGVLEHVESPVVFIRQLLDLLRRGGAIYIGVPDCAPYVEVGDLSCLIHEHWSYFDRATLGRTLALAEGKEIHVTQSGFGGLLYASVRRDGSAGGGEPAAAEPRLATFRSQATHAMERLADFLHPAYATGVYVPGRIINALVAARIERAGLRFFDDNTLLRGTYFPGVPIPIESRTDLLETPTERLLIMSRSFGAAIAGQLTTQLPPRTVIRTWEDVFASA
jgi:SAM-dependent methyltransferase